MRRNSYNDMEPNKTIISVIGLASVLAMLVGGTVSIYMGVWTGWAGIMFVAGLAGTFIAGIILEPESKGGDDADMP